MCPVYPVSRFLLNMYVSGPKRKSSTGSEWIVWLGAAFHCQSVSDVRRSCRGSTVTIGLIHSTILYLFCFVLFCSVLFFSRPRPEGWPHHGRTFSIYLCPLSFWLTLPLGVLSTSWCCPSRPCVVFIACVHLELFLALSLSPRNSLVSSWCDHSMLASLFWRCLTVPSLLQLC